MTGAAVRALRVRGGFSVSHFAELLGVSRPTVYRWEAQPRPLIDPLQAKLLFVLAARSPEELEAIRLAVVVGSTLRGIAALLEIAGMHIGLERRKPKAPRSTRKKHKRGA